MRKLICLLLSLALCAGLMLPVLAAESRFIPSYGLEILEATKGNEDVKDCLIVTSVTEAGDESTDISKEERDQLKGMYDGLSDGSLLLPAVGEYEVMELMDLRFTLACREQSGHTHPEGDLTVKFRLENTSYDVLGALTYAGENWVPVKGLVDNGDGTVTITMEEAGPVVFLNFVYEEEQKENEDETEIDYNEGVSRFLPSVTYKNGPTIKEAILDGKDAGGCVIVTSLKEAEEKTTDLSQEDRDLLLDIYKQLEEGTMVLPLKGAYVIRDLVDVSFAYEACTQDMSHGKKDEHLGEKEILLSVTFELDVEADETVFVMTYVDEEWILVSEVENNGDGTITCEFEDICPVVFAVADKEKAPWNPSTGDTAGNQLMLVMTMMLLSAAGVVTLAATKARKIR